MTLHRVMSLLFAFSVGLMLAVFSFRWITNPDPARQRVVEEAAVMVAREVLTEQIQAPQPLQIIDPLEKDRVVGKGYVYPEGDGWQVSGYYRRDARDRWHPFMMTLGAELELEVLTLGDDEPGLVRRAAADPRITATDKRGEVDDQSPDPPDE